MYRIAVVGDRDSIYGFAALGMETFAVSNFTEAKETLKKLVNENTMIIYLTENFINDDISKFMASSSASIIPIPGLCKNTNIGMKNVRRLVEKAVGTDILA